MNHQRTFILIGLLCFLAAAGIRINNNFRFAPACGYDAGGHLSYIYQLKAGWGIPLASEGWSTFHPPLYYFIMAGLWKHVGPLFPWPMHILFRLISTLLNLGMAVLAVITMKLIWPDDSFPALLGACFILFVPLHIYTSSMIGNEQMAAFLTSLGLVLLVLYYRKPDLWIHLAAGMGVICGLALLAKYTGALLLLTIIICLISKVIFDAGKRRKHIFALAAVLIGCLLVCGGFYARNIYLFGHPFALSQDYPCVAEVMIKQPPGRRRWVDFFGFDFTIFQDPIIRKVREGVEYSRSRYVWSLVYSNFWFESFSHFFLVHCDPWRQQLGKLLLVLGIFPTVLLGVEAGRESVATLCHKLDTPMFPLVVLLFLNIAAFISFNLKTPHFSAGKASYFLASGLPLAIFMSRGMQQWLLRRGKIGKAAGILLLAAIFGISFTTFFLTHI